MFTLFRIVLMLLIISLPLPLTACGPGTQIVKKPEGLLKSNSGLSYDLSSKDRQKWKSVLNWCDECDARAKPYIDHLEKYGGRHGGIFIYSIGDNQYIVDINCHMTMRQCEHIYYKVTERADTIESRLLILEQFYHAEYGDDEVKGVTNPKGEFVRSTDTVAYGFTIIPENNQKQLIVETEYRGVGGCGLYTLYDVSGDCPKVVEFRAKIECTEDYPPPEKWKLYPSEQRAKWRIVPNPRRYDWKPSPTSPACSK
jgi:hypothetical protein